MKGINNRQKKVVTPKREYQKNKKRIHNNKQSFKNTRRK